MVDQQNKQPSSDELKKTRMEQLEDKISALEESMGSILTVLESIQEAGVGAGAPQKKGGLFGGKRKKTAMKDTKTGIVYPSRAAMGKALADAFGFDPEDSFVYYKIMTAAEKGRIVEATPGESEKVWADEAAKREKEVEEANKRLAAEEAAKEAAEKKAAAPTTPASQPVQKQGPVQGKPVQPKK